MYQEVSRSGNKFRTLTAKAEKVVEIVEKQWLDVPYVWPDFPQRILLRTCQRG
jgi:hypothetical protein